MNLDLGGRLREGGRKRRVRKVVNEENGGARGGGE